VCDEYAIPEGLLLDRLPPRPLMAVPSKPAWLDDYDQGMTRLLTQAGWPVEAGSLLGRLIYVRTKLHGIIHAPIVGVAYWQKDGREGFKLQVMMGMTSVAGTPTQPIGLIEYSQRTGWRLIPRSLFTDGQACEVYLS
jgi:hypothetical protein